MNHQEICNGKLVIIDPLLTPAWKKDNKTMDTIPRKLAYSAHVILEDLHDGSFAVLKNRFGKAGEIISKKELTMFMLKLGE
jgi:hypothetical protein